MSNVLKETSLCHLRSLQHVVILKDSATVEQVLRTLASHRLVSAPVVRDDTSPAAHHGPTWPMHQAPAEVAGFVDVKSIISKFLKDIEENGILQMRSMLRRMRALEQQGLLFSKKTIKDHDLLSGIPPPPRAVARLGLGGDGSFLHVEQDSLSLLELASEALLGNSRRERTTADLPNVVHRIAIFDSASRIVNVISQSDIVRYLLEHAEELGETGLKTVQELGFGKTKIISVAPELPAVEALNVMNAKKIGALAVVNSGGKIVGNFSAADMRTITPEHFGSLALPVGEFLALEHGVEYAGYAIPSGRGQESNSSGEESAERRLDRGKSVDFLESKIPLGSIADQAVLQFARGAPERTHRPPGSDVGQNLIICSMDHTLIDVLRLLSQSRVHRVFIADEQEKPIGVITCTDILRTLVDIYK